MRIIKPLVLILTYISVAVFLFGCTGRGGQEKEEQPQEQTVLEEKNQDQGVLAEFERLIRENAAEKEILAYIDANIVKVTKESANQLVTGFEARQKKALEELDQQFASGKEEKWTKTIHNGLQKEFGYSFSMQQLGEIKDPEIKKMLEEVRDTGYRVRSAEGMYFPVIDYQFYQRYYAYLTEDIKNYYVLMATESNSPPAADAALLITPDEILKRIVAQENYLKGYPGSAKLKDIEELYLRYVNFYLFGLNNTPAFAYNTRVLRKDFQESYNNFDPTAGGKFAEAFSGYFEVLKNANYTLTDKVVQERQKVIDKVKQ
ncbi:MAG: hypothetical protein A4E53_03919 [Pelotomaculum sp. PtaB.Bin104]|nr:MAG: hypothetical protein A4E53_03919 [Pelotomaculum sp. PtaB.Bin104]